MICLRAHCQAGAVWLAIESFLELGGIALNDIGDSLGDDCVWVAQRGQERAA